VTSSWFFLSTRN